jgi:hypothetical protein
MLVTCKNCNQKFKGYYCSHCGQSSETHAMNLHFVWHDIQHGIFHFDKGLLYTAKQLFTRPGNSIREYIEGKRVQHFKPISLIIVLATAYGLIYHYFNINPFQGDFATGLEKVLNGEETEKILKYKKINEWIATHYSWASLFTLPLYAISSFFAFKKSGYNFIEHLILNAFIVAQGIILHFFFFPLFYLLNGTPEGTSVIFGATIFDVVFLVWTYIQFFSK